MRLWSRRQERNTQPLTCPRHLQPENVPNSSALPPRRKIMRQLRKSSAPCRPLWIQDATKIEIVVLIPKNRHIFHPTSALTLLRMAADPMASTYSAFGNGSVSPATMTKECWGVVQVTRHTKSTISLLYYDAG
jgi:hypothetical protein